MASKGFCATAAGNCDPPYGALSDDDFILDGTTYTVESIRWGLAATDNLHLTLDKDFPAGSLANLTLQVGPGSFALSAALRGNKNGNIDNNYRWSPYPQAIADLLFGETVTVTLVSGSTTVTNAAPTVANAILDQTATVGTALNYAFPTNTFADTDAGDTLTYTATQSDDSALPSWLTFAAATRTFSGTPQAADVGTVSVKVTASDGTDSVSDTFDIVVSAANIAPIGAPTITGTARVGWTLTAVTTGITDANGLTSPGFTYQWIRVNGTEADIAGENSSTYTLVAADLGKTIKVKVNFTDDDGYAETLTSGAYPTSGTVQADNTLVSNVGQAAGKFYGFGSHDLAQPFTTGANVTGYTLTSIELNLDSTQSTITPTVKLYSGSANGTEEAAFTGPAMLGPGSANYTFTPSSTVILLRSTTYWVVAEGTGNVLWRGTVTDEDATSAADWEIGDIAEARTANATGNFAIELGAVYKIRVNGTLGGLVLSNDATLSALALEDASDDSAITISPVFASATTSYTASVDNDVDEITIKPAVNESHAMVEYLDSSDTAITDADSGKTGQQVSLSVSANTIKVKVTAEDTTTTNPYTVVVTRAANTPATGAPSISGTATVRQVLTATTGTIADADGLPANFTYQWVRVDADGTSNEADITGANSSTYTLADDDEIKKIKVKVSFTDNGGNSETRTSGAYPTSGTVQASSTPVSAALVSNTGQTHYRILNVNPRFVYAQGFSTGNSAAELGSVTLADLTNVAAGESLVVSLYSESAGLPGTSLHTLTAPGTLSNGDATFTVPTGTTVTLEATTSYFIHIAFAGASGVVKVSTTASDTEDSGGTIGWSLADNVKLSTSGGAFGDHSAPSRAIRLSINGTLGTTTTNNAPTSADEHVEADEDMDYTFSSADFLFTDTDTGDSLASVKIVTLPGSGTGTLTLSGTVIGSGDLPKTVLAAEIDDLQYSPPANLHGTDVASFTFKVNDGTDDSADTYTMNINVGPENDPATGEPTISGTARVGRMLAASTAGIMDVDGLPSTFSYQWLRKAGPTTTSISGANSSTYTLQAPDLGNKVAVRVSFTDDDGSSETLTSAATATVTTAITVSYVPLESEVTEGAGSIDLRISVTSHPTAGTPQAFEVLLSTADGTATVADDYVVVPGQLIQFGIGDTSKDHTILIIDDSVVESDETFTSTLSIGSGQPAVIDTRTDFGATATITIKDDDTANTAPTSADEHVEADEDMDYTFSSADFLFTDTDTGDSLASVKIVTLPASGTGTLTLSGTVIGSGDLPQTVLAAEIDNLKFSPPANLNGLDFATFTFKVNDGTVDSDDAFTITVDVTAMNDPATGKPGITGTAQVGQTLTATAGTIADVEGVPNPFFSAAATTVQWIQVDGATETDISGATNETYTLATADEGKKIKVKVSFEDEDGTAEGPLTSDAYPSSDTVTAANTAPTSADEHVEADEDTDYTFEADDFPFTDTDTGDSLASVKIVTLPASGRGTLTLSGTAIGSGDLPKTVLEDDLDDLQYSPPANLYGTDFASFTFKVNDGTDDSADTYTMNINVGPANDPATGEPTISGTARVGRMLTVSTAGIMDVDGLPSTFSYRWLRKVGATTTSISGANSSTYTLQAADLGNKVAVRVSFTDTGGNSEMRTSGDYPTSGTVLANNTLVSNAGQIESNFGSLAADDLAQPFTTGTNATGYTLSSIELNLDSTVSTNTPTVKLYSGSANGTEVSTFTGPATLGSGIASYTFTPFSTVTLRRSTTYWVVAEGATRWTYTRTGTEDATPATGWSIADNYEFRTASLTGSFTATNTGDALQIRVNGTLGGIVLSSDATLSALALEDASDDSAIDISPTFASGTTSYTASVDNDVDGITIKPTVNESNATVEYLDSSDTEIADAISGKTGQQVLLAVGANTIKVKVTAEDTTTANPYTVVVTRAVVADTTPPEVVSVTVPISGSEVELVFDEDLDGNVGGNLLASVFSLTVAGQAVTIPDYDYAIQEAALFLYVQPGTIKQGQTVVVSYTDPTAGDDTVALQDIAGNDVASFTTGMSGVPAVTNDSTVTPNTAPTGADNTVTMATDRSYTFVADEFGFADTDAGDTLDSISIVTPPASGTLAFDGTAVMADDVVTKAQLDNIFGDHLTFTPAAGASGDPYTSFTFKVNDGTDDSAAAYTMSITVNAIGAVSTAEVPDNWALKPADIGAGEQFRLIFQASGHPATSADIATYNSHVRSDAGAGVTALRSYADDFRALVSTQAVNVRTNTMTRATDTGVPIYWVRSDPVVAGDRVADNYADFYDGSWATGGTGYGARGFSRLLDTHVTWTGSNANGTTHSTGYMGASSNLAIWSVSSSGAISTVAEDPPSSNYGIFALSPVFQVSTTTVNTAATGVPTITGTAQVGETLTAVTTGIMDADGLTSPTYTYQWIRVDGSEADIASANSSTYTLDAADLGKTIKVKVSFTDDASNTETLTSAATATVTAATVTPVSGVLVSNVGQTPFDFVELNLLDAAQSFTTGDNATGYTLTSIELRFDSSASTDTPTVKLYSGSANGTEEATLIGPAMLDADTTKNYAFTSSSTVTLGMSTTYWVVAEANTGSVRWIDTHSPSEDATPAAHWTIADGREDRSASSTGSFMTTAGNPLLIRVNGTTVATPTTSSDATLSALALENASDDSAITISPTFASGTTSYTASVDNDVDGITIKPTVNESSATVEYLDSSDTAITDADAVKAGQQVSLLVGANTIKVKVTAEDTTTTSTYTVVVTRGAATAPGAPTALTATANGQSQIDLAWTAPADTGGPAIAITGYRIEVSPDGSSWSDLVAATASTATTYAHTGLNAATNRHYRVSAINAVGTSDPSGSDDATTEASTATAQTEMVPVDWALKPADIGVGEQFRLMFATSTFRNARSTNIADYNTFVRTSAAAGLTALHTYANDFTALVSTGSVNARANTLTRATDTDAPVYWVRSSVDATHRAADGYADFFDGSWATSWRGYNESGSQLSTTRFWTGSNTDGTTHATQFMGPTGATASAAHWLLATPDNVTGSTPSLSTSRIVALSPVFQVANTAPTGADKTVTIGSDTAYTFEADDFGFVDTDAGATLVSVRIESVPLAGDLELNGTAVSLNDVIPSADIGDLTFTPAAGGSGDAYASFMFKVNDGTDFSANVNTITFNVRDLSCAAPDFAGDNRHQLWTGIVTVGEIDDVGYGFRSDLSQTELDDTTFAIGRNSYTVDSAFVLSASPFVGQMRFSLAGNEQNNLTAGERAALRLHVCDTAIYNFSASGANAENTYDWAGSLDWSPPVATRTLYLSLPANRDAMGEPAITGTAQVGQDLTADVTGITDADGLTGDLSTPTDDSNLGGVEYSYQWIRVDADGASNEEDISGEIAETYTLTDDDVGKKVKVKVGFTDDLNGEEERTSAAYPSSGTVTAANTAPVFSSPSVSRSIAENTAAGQNVGAAVTATDADAGDTLAYTLGGTDAASFDFVEATGQIRTKSGVSYDFEAKDPPTR